MQSIWSSPERFVWCSDSICNQGKSTKSLNKGSQVSINFTKKHLLPPENYIPLKSYYDPLPKSDIKVMTEMQKTVRIQFNSVTINEEVMYLSLFVKNSFWTSAYSC